MNILEIVKAEYLSILSGAIGGGLLGVFTSLFTQKILNKRGTFTYTVDHRQIGITTKDEIFGDVAVTWQGNQISNLYLSSVELKNESMNDYENVIIKAYTSDSNLMTEQSQFLDSPNILEHSENFKKLLFVKKGSTPTDPQWKIYYGQREYMIPIFNRGESIRVTYLNEAKNPDTQPNIWLSISLKGVKLKFREPQVEIFGVPQPRAAFVGLLFGIIVVVFMLFSFENVWLTTFAAFSIGLIAQLPGAYIIKAYRYSRDLIAG